MSDLMVIKPLVKSMILPGMESAGDVFEMVGRPDSLPEWESVDSVYFAHFAAEMADYVADGKAERKIALVAKTCAVLMKDGEIVSEARTIFCPAYVTTALRSLGLDMATAKGGETLDGVALYLENKGTIKSNTAKKADAHRITVLRTSDAPEIMLRVYAAMETKAAKIRAEIDQRAGIINGDDF